MNKHNLNLFKTNFFKTGNPSDGNLTFEISKIFIFKLLKSMEDWSAGHLIYSSEPHSKHFLVRATSKCSSFHFFFFKCALIYRLKIFFRNLNCEYRVVRAYIVCRLNLAQ